MAIDFTIGFTATEVEEMLAVYKLELKKVIFEYKESGSEVKRRRWDELGEMISACQRALRKLDPDTYGTQHRTSTSSVSNTFNA